MKSFALFMTIQIPSQTDFIQLQLDFICRRQISSSEWTISLDQRMK